MTRIGRSAFLGGALVALAASFPLAASESSGYSVSVLVDGYRVAEYAARNGVYVEAVKGREFVIRLSNPTSRRVAVALSVDGRNVIDAKRTSAGEAAKWVLGPWETLDVPGWQVSGATARRFFFPSARNTRTSAARPSGSANRSRWQIVLMPSPSVLLCVRTTFHSRSSPSRLIWCRSSRFSALGSCSASSGGGACGSTCSSASERSCPAGGW